MNEAQLWLIIFLQTAHLILHFAYIIFSIILRLTIYRRTSETDTLIKEALKNEL